MPNKSTTDSNLAKGFTQGSEKKEIKPPKYSEDEKNNLMTLYKMLGNARSEREKKREEFDDMSYTQYYDTNRRADLGYLAKKKNKEDTRVSTGLSREKDNTLLSVLLKFDFEPFIQAFDQDDFFVNDMGSEMADIVKKTREMEDYAERRYYIYREYISQGDVFVEEILDFPSTFTKESADKNIVWTPEMPISSFKQNVDIVKGLPIAISKVIPGKKVYLGDYRIEQIEDQPFIFTYEVISRKDAELKYGTWSRWENVPMTIDTIEAISSSDQIGVRSWGFTKTSEDEVGVLKFQRKGLNEYQVILNGVPMLPLGYPLTAVSPSGEYTLSQGKFQAITNFALSKGQPANIKFDEQTLNEFYKLMILKMQQSLKPPMGNKTGKTIDASVFLPGKIVNDVSPKQLFPLFTSQGPTQGEFSFFNLVKQSIEDKSINRTFAGQTQEGNVTATQIIEEKQQQMLRLGLALDGIVNLERRMVWKRIFTIINKYTDPIKEEKMGDKVQKIFRTFTYETDVDGQKGIKIFHFTDQPFLEPREQQRMETDLSQDYDKPVSVVFIDPVVLKSFKGVWRVGITPSERSNSDYQSFVFTSKVRESYELFGGPEGHNQEYLRQKFGNINNVDSNKWFNNAPPPPPEAPGAGQTGKKPKPAGEQVPPPNPMM